MTQEQCACGASFRGRRRDWLLWRGAHVCVIPLETLPDRSGADSVTQVRTQDGRWLFDREMPVVMMGGFTA